MQNHLNRPTVRERQTFQSLTIDCLKINFNFCNRQTCSDTSIPDAAVVYIIILSLCASHRVYNDIIVVRKPRRRSRLLLRAQRTTHDAHRASHAQAARRQLNQLTDTKTSRGERFGFQKASPQPVKLAKVPLITAVGRTAYAPILALVGRRRVSKPSASHLKRLVSPL